MTDSALATGLKGYLFMKDTVKRISVRLDDEAASVLLEAHQKGISTTEFICKCITSGGGCIHKDVFTHIANMQSMLEHEDDPYRKEMRKELHALCRALKL